MATKNKVNIVSDIVAEIRSGNSDTTAAGVRTILYEFLDSYVNVKDGGLLYEAEVGYNYLPTTLSPGSFINKAFADLNYGGGSQSLQQVTDIGNTTTNDIQFEYGVGVLLDNGSRLREGTIDAGYGGSKGIAQICAVGYELKWEAGRQYVMDGNGVLIRHSLNNFTTIPDINSDSTKGYYVGSLWTLDNGISYICTDSTSGAATWDLYDANPQVNSDWNSTSGASEIFNKPTIPTQAVPVGGTAGQILAKVDSTDYNLEWIENYANYTSTLKHTVKANVTLIKGQAVYVSGASGTNMLVSKASNVSEPTSSKTLGLIAQNLAINGQGFVITEGLLTNLNTNTATIGDPVWLGVNGDLIYGLTNKPHAPSHLVFIGIVTRVSSTVGEIFIKIQNGFELKEIHDVDLITNTPINNDVLTYDSLTSLWKNKQLIVKVADYASLPTIGDLNTLYIANLTEQYSWNGISYDYLNPPTVSDNTSVTLFAAAATTNVLPNNIYSNGTLGVGATLSGTVNGAIPNQDGVPLSEGSLLLVKDEASSFKNGLYELTFPGNSSFPYTLTRSIDSDESNELFPSQVNVLAGTVNANKYFLQKTTNPTVGSSAIIYETIVTPVPTVSPLSFVATVTDAILPNLPTYANGSTVGQPALNATLTATTNGLFPTINGVTPYVGMTILVKNQASFLTNGDYTLITIGSVTTKWQLRRIGYSPSTLYGKEWMITEGTNLGNRYFQTNKSLVLSTIGSSGNIVFVSDLISSYTTIEDEGTPVTQRSNINFIGAGVSVADVGGKSVVTISGSGSIIPAAVNLFNFYNNI